jgi:uncharacterized membrane protein
MHDRCTIGGDMTEAGTGRPERWALGALWGVTLLAAVGYATFGRHPQLLARVPTAAAFYTYSFQIFSIGQIVLAGLVLGYFLVRRTGLVWIPSFVVLYAISLTSELAGTGYGLPFGEYEYSPLLGVAWLGRVPAVIPLSWFCMALPSYALALRVYPRSAAGRILFASMVLLAWDLALDPAMSYATRYWVWGEVGPYYGMPLLNLFGWYVTGIALMGALALLRTERWLAELPGGWLASYYGANLALPLAMCAAAGLWGAVAATLVVLGGVWWFASAAMVRAQPIVGGELPVAEVRR